jgi:hypothetical protein
MDPGPLAPSTVSDSILFAARMGSPSGVVVPRRLARVYRWPGRDFAKSLAVDPVLFQARRYFLFILCGFSCLDLLFCSGFFDMI